MSPGQLQQVIEVDMLLHPSDHFVEAFRRQGLFGKRQTEVPAG